MPVEGDIIDAAVHEIERVAPMSDEAKLEVYVILRGLARTVTESTVRNTVKLLTHTP